MSSFLERLPDLGKKPIPLTIRLPPVKQSNQADELTEKLQQLYKKGEFTDVSLIVADQTFKAHRCVLASQSEVFKQGLASPGASPHEVRLADIPNPEAVKFMLDYMYHIDGSVWADYQPGTQEINKDVLRLAQNFKLPGLRDRAAHWLSKDLTTGNVVERLTICEDFGLTELKENILNALTFNRRALAEVAHSPQIMSYPKLMQAMLQLAATVPEERAEEPMKDSNPKKKAKKA
eukprot:TRINITY_DN26062_c0_g1_i1.p1 TRINITY_DN26062_c0_g1~~TRINITY_DN26062_c0_g1_i1.p1  ORF type:complete len:250 (-),score=52.14 TRINITY_DN26062_c0_g1_i1:372-1073(-)